MARITVDDCLDHVDNRFELVHVAAARTRQLDSGYKSLLSDAGKTGEKNTILALREIAEGKVDRNIIKKQDLGIFDASEEEEGMEKTLQDMVREEMNKRGDEGQKGVGDAELIEAKEDKQSGEEAISAAAKKLEKKSAPEEDKQSGEEAISAAAKKLEKKSAPEEDKQSGEEAISAAAKKLEKKSAPEEDKQSGEEAISAAAKKPEEQSVSEEDKQSGEEAISAAAKKPEEQSVSEEDKQSGEEAISAAAKKPEEQCCI